jgi:hypothetical protein
MTDEPGEFDHLEEPGEFDHLEEESSAPAQVLIDPNDIQGYMGQMALLQQEHMKLLSSGAYYKPGSLSKPRRKKPLNVKRAARKRRVFLDALAKTGNATKAAQIAGYASMTRLYEYRKEHPEFAKAWEEAMDMAGDVFEAEAARRAVEGTYEPVFYKGEIVGYKLVHSDGLLTTLLKGAKKEKYADRKQVENNHTGQIGVAVLPATISVEDWETTAKQVHANQKFIDVTAEEVEFVEEEPEQPSRKGEIAR